VRLWLARQFIGERDAFDSRQLVSAAFLNASEPLFNAQQCASVAAVMKDLDVLVNIRLESPRSVRSAEHKPASTSHHSRFVTGCSPGPSADLIQKLAGLKVQALDAQGFVGSISLFRALSTSMFGEVYYATELTALAAAWLQSNDGHLRVSHWPVCND